MANAWLALALLIVVVVSVLLYLRRPSMEGFGEFAASSKRFADQQYTYFHDAAGKGIFINPGLVIADLNGSLRQPDLYLPNSPDRDYTSYFVEDPENAFGKKDGEMCRGAKHPNNLPALAPGERMGCGWWYVPDPTIPSQGVLGTRDGPAIRTSLPSNGQWIWDRPDAIKKEDIKVCKRVRSCELMNTAGIYGECGFCERNGYAVPINPDGTEKYPNDLIGSCGEPTILKRSQCFKPAPFAVNTPDGVSCGRYGVASPDNSIRLYTKSECETLGGNWQTTGQCLRPQGGSFSVDCRALNNPPNLLGSAPAKKCDPNPKGFLSRDCLITLAEGLGFNKNGSILIMLYTVRGPDENERMVIAELRNNGVLIPDAVLGTGDIDVDSASRVFKILFDTMTTGKTSKVREAAKYLVSGNAEFDGCDYEGSARGPFDITCLQRRFREAGCQPAGAAFPTEKNAGFFATMTYDDVAGLFKQLHDSMKSSVVAEQDKAIKDCLGISYYRKPPIPCKNPGIEYLFYSWSANDWMQIKIMGASSPLGVMGSTVTYAAFIGAEYYESGFQRIDVGGGIINNTKRYDNVFLKARGRVLTQQQTINGRIDVWTDDGCAILINDKPILNAWRDQAPTYYGVNVNLPTNSENLLEVHWYENGGGALLDIRGVMDTMNTSMYLPFPKGAPIVSFDFFRDRLDDIHGTFMSAPSNLSLVNKNNRRGAQFSGYGSQLHILTPYRLGAFRTMTWMVYWDSNSAQAPYLFHASRNFDTATGTSVLVRGGAKNTTIEFQYNASATDRYNIYNTNGAPVGRWVHYAVVYSADFKGASFYTDGVLSFTQRYDKMYNYGPNPDEVLRHIYLGRPSTQSGTTPISYVAENGLNCTMGWFHMYDRALSMPEIADEMKYWDSVDYSKGNIPSFRRGWINGVQV